MGSKYIFKPDSNPPVGLYNVDVNGIKPKIIEVKFNEKKSTY